MAASAMSDSSRRSDMRTEICMWFSRPRSSLASRTFGIAVGAMLALGASAVFVSASAVAEASQANAAPTILMSGS